MCVTGVYINAILSSSIGVEKSSSSYFILPYRAKTWLYKYRNINIDMKKKHKKYTHLCAVEKKLNIYILVYLYTHCAHLFIYFFTYNIVEQRKMWKICCIWNSDVTNNYAGHECAHRIFFSMLNRPRVDSYFICLFAWKSYIFYMSDG